MTLAFGSLFAGIGGFDLGFERAGMRCEWQVEIDEYCREVLAKHWPLVRRHDDIRTFVPTYVDVVCGGFPCQDISNAGHRVGIDGQHSGMWRHFARIIREIRPRVVVVENVPALLVRGMDRVLGDLAACGYGAEWDCIPASAFGAPHRRDRVFICAYPEGLRLEGRLFPKYFNATTCGQWNGKPARVLARDWPGRADGPWHPRVANGIPNWMERVKAYGNAVVPQVAEFIGKRIVKVFDNG